MQGTLGRLHQRKPGDKVHFCISCSCPIATYGRLFPCLHSYCLSCATDMAQCYICRSQIARIERIPQEQGLYISPATLQGFKSEAQLEEHTREAHQSLLAHKDVAGGIPLPGLTATPLHHVGMGAGGRH